MNIIAVTQGSQEWLSLRRQHYTASEAAAMLGLSKYMTRTELLQQKKTGIVHDVDDHKQRLFDRGHEAETAARPVAEAMIGEDLYPETGTLDVNGLPLLASFDGITMDERIIWENKMPNAALRDYLNASSDLPATHWPQVEQQLLISGAEKCLFTVSDGDENSTCCLWYSSKPERRAKLIAGWKQFAADLANYKHVEAPQEAVAQPIEALPALFISLVGEVRESNIVLFRDKALHFIDSISTDLVSDDDFAQAESNVKFCDEAEKKIRAVKEAAIGQTASIDELFRTIDLLAEQMRSKRLSLEKLVKAKKESRRAEIILAADAELREYVEAINKRLENVRLPTIPGRFAEAVKGKKTLTGCQESVNDALAAAKILADQTANHIERNLITLAKAGHDFLFADRANLVGKTPDDLLDTIAARLAKHQAAEAAKLEFEREKIRKEEQAKAQREAAELARAEQQRIDAERAVEAKRKAEADRIAAAEEARKLREKLAPAPAVQQMVQPANLRSEINDALDQLTKDQLVMVRHFIDRMLEHREAA